MYTDDIATLQSDDVTADEFVEYTIREYGMFMLDSKVPNIVDGLKTVHRRIIHTLGTTEEYEKMSTIAGTVMQIHPHGDASIASAILNLTLPYSNIIPLVDCDSNVGTYAYPDDASQPRYLDIKSHPFTRDVFFKYTDKVSLKQKVTVTGKGYEPSYFIPAIPYSLLVCTVGMGPGFKTEIYPLSFDNMYKLTMAYLDHRKGKGQIKMSSFARYLVPDFPTAGIIRNRRQLIQQYKEGDYNASILVEGKMTLTKNTILISNIPYGIRFPDNTEDKIRREVLNKTSLGLKISSVMIPVGMGTSVNEGAVEINLIRGVDPFSVLDEIKKKCKFCHYKSPYRLYVDETGTGHLSTPKGLLDQWYKSRYNSILVSLKYKQKKLIQEQRKYEAIIIAKDNIDDVLNVFKTSVHWEEACNILHKKYNLTPYQSKYLKDIKLEKITSKGREELQLNLDNIILELKGYNHQFLTIDERIKREVKQIYNDHKHYTTRSTVFPKYYGYVKFKTGVIQVFDRDELDSVLSGFNRVPSKIHIYGKVNYNYIVKNGNIIDESVSCHPKEFSCDDYYSLPYPLKQIVGLTDDNRIYRTKGLKLRTNITANQYPTGDVFIGIHDSGYVEKIEASSITRLTKTDIMFISHKQCDSMIIAYSNSKKKNRIRFEKINIGDSLKFFSGKNTIIGIYEPTDDILMNLPTNMLPRFNDKLFIKDINKFFKGKQIVTLNLTTMTNNVGVKLKRF